MPRPTPDWIKTLQTTTELTPALTNTLIEQHGSRARKAITAICENRIKQYNDFTVVVGHHEEYIIENNNCNCDDTHYNLDHDDPTDKCWHTIAAIIATELDLLDKHDVWYTDVWTGMN